MFIPESKLCDEEPFPPSSKDNCPRKAETSASECSCRNWFPPFASAIDIITSLLSQFSDTAEVSVNISPESGETLETIFPKAAHKRYVSNDGE